MKLTYTIISTPKTGISKLIVPAFQICQSKAMENIHNQNQLSVHSGSPQVSVYLGSTEQVKRKDLHILTLENWLEV